MSVDKGFLSDHFTERCSQLATWSHDAVFVVPTVTKRGLAPTYFTHLCQISFTETTLKYLKCIELKKKGLNYLLIRSCLKCEVLKTLESQKRLTETNSLWSGLEKTLVHSRLRWIVIPDWVASSGGTSFETSTSYWKTRTQKRLSILLVLHILQLNLI